MLMKNAGLVSSSWDDFYAIRDDHFASVFDFRGIESSPWKFSHNVQTDGVSVCFHLRRPKTEVEEAVMKKKVRKTKNKQWSSVPPEQRVIAIDPGRVNMVYGIEELPDGEHKVYCLKRGRYYVESGMSTAKRRAAKWEADIADEEAIFRQHSPRTTDGASFDMFVQDYASVYNKLWESKLKRKWGQSRFRVYCLKKRLLDRFFQSMRGDVPVIAYGAAKFNPCGKNELAVPTTHLSRVCATHFKTVMVDEFRTSQICASCDA